MKTNLTSDKIFDIRFDRLADSIGTRVHGLNADWGSKVITVAITDTVDAYIFDIEEKGQVVVGYRINMLGNEDDIYLMTKYMPLNNSKDAKAILSYFTTLTEKEG